MIEPNWITDYIILHLQAFVPRNFVARKNHILHCRERFKPHVIIHLVCIVYCVFAAFCRIPRSLRLLEIKEKYLMNALSLFQVNIRPRCSMETRQPARLTPRRYCWCSPSFWVSWDNVRVHKCHSRHLWN